MFHDVGVIEVAANFAGGSTLFTDVMSFFVTSGGPVRDRVRVIFMALPLSRMAIVPMG